MEMKTCTKCKKELPLTEFQKYRRSKDGLQSWCKICSKIYREPQKEKRRKSARQYYKSHKEKIRKLRKQYRELHKEEAKQYYESHKEEKRKLRKQYRELHKEEAKQYRESHKEEMRKLQKQYYESHKEEKKRHYESHKEEKNAQQKNYYKTHKESVIAQINTWKKKNKDKRNATEQRRRARKRKTIVIPFNEKKWLESQKPFRCYLCGKRIKEGAPYHIEHRIPLSRNGSHSPWNNAISCPKCNLSKHDKTPWEFMPEKFQPELSL